jgi:hypothetical protein
VKYSIETAVRMVGNLLKFHPTTGTLARDSNGRSVSEDSARASCFCYMGACFITARKLNLEDSTVVEQCDHVLGKVMDGYFWDNGSEWQRAAWADKLANYRERYQG